MRKTTHHRSPVCEPQNSDGIVALSARLSNLADRISAANSGKAGIKRASRVAPPRANVHGDDRVWPPMSKLPEVPQSKAKLQPYLDELSGEDFAIPAQQQATQTEELRRACDQIDHLIATINALRLEADGRDRNLATATQQLIETENETSGLKAALSAERRKTTALSQRLIEVETAFNDRLVDVTVHRETAERLSSELILAKTEAPKELAAAEVRAHRLFAEQVARLTERHEQQIQELRLSVAKQVAGLSERHDRQVQELQSVIAEGDRQKAHLERSQTELAVLFCALSDKIAGLESEKQQATETICAQAGQIEFLETTTVIERQNAEATIKELAAEFGRERKQLLARESAAAEIRKNIVQLLPKLIARRDAAEPETAQVA